MRGDALGVLEVSGRGGRKWENPNQCESAKSESHVAHPDIVRSDFRECKRVNVQKSF